MEQLNEILYVATLRCNYMCKHCGARRLYSESEEISCEKVLQRIEDSNATDTCEIVITGGEPFLKKDIGDMILGITNNKEKLRHVSITSSGYFTEKMESIVSKISDPRRVSFSISIDGLEESHNRIRGNKEAYKRAIKTAQMLASYGIAVEINTVMQLDNLDDLAPLKKLISNMGSTVKWTPIPLTVDTSTKDASPFNSGEIQKMFPYVRAHNDIKHIISKGEFRITDCHAGHKNLVIDPVGKALPCARSAAYLPESDCRAQYIFGNLSTETIDVILSGRQRKRVCEDVVKFCVGCNANHDVNREEFFWGLKHSLSIEELSYIFDTIKPPIKYFLDFNFDGEEHDGDITYHWMNCNKANVYLPKPAATSTVLVVTYRNVLPADPTNPLSAKAEFDGEIYDLESKIGIHTLEMQIHIASDAVGTNWRTLTLRTNRTWRPSEVFGGNDNRDLAIAFISAEYKEC